MRLPVVLGALTLGLAACGGSPAPREGKPLLQIAFGVQGGNIAPWRVVIERDGAVDSSGPIRPTVGKLSVAQRLRVSQLVRQARAGGLSSRRCPNTLPDVASRFIDADHSRVTVHGTCDPRFERLFKALSNAVGLRPARR